MGKRNSLAKKATPTDIISHWPKLIENLQFSSQEFYSRVEKALEDRQIPNLKVSRVDWKEGGMFSARREYLRLQRERLVFDICAASFGTSFFVSLWFGQKPLKLAGLLLLALAIIAVWIVGNVEPWLGVYWYSRRYFNLEPIQVNLILLAALMIVALVILIRCAKDLDAALIGLPIIGYFYERYFRRITYYRIDLRCMYQTAVHTAVADVIDEISKANGIPLLSEFDRRPVLRGLVATQGYDGRN